MVTPVKDEHSLVNHAVLSGTEYGYLINHL
jgi:hypothetical protein